MTSEDVTGRPARSPVSRFLFNHRRELDHMMRKRYALLMFALLIGWSLVASLPSLEPIMGNALLLDTFLHLGVVTALNTMAVVFCVAVLRLMNRRFPKLVFRDSPVWVGTGREPWNARQVVLVTMAAVVTPIWLAWKSRDHFMGFWQAIRFRSEDAANPGVMELVAAFPSRQVALFSAVAILGGMVAAWLGLFLLGRIKCRLFGSSQAGGNYLPLEPGGVGGVAQLNLGRLRQNEIDAELGIYTLLLFAVHFLLVELLPGVSLSVSSAPAAIILLIWFLGLVLSGLAYWLDQVRVPVLLVMLTLGVVIQLSASSAARFHTVPIAPSTTFSGHVADIRNAEVQALAEKSDPVELVQEKAQAFEEDLWRVLCRRAENVGRDLGPPNGNSLGAARETPAAAELPAALKKPGRTLVIVTCPGGGIHAAAWASKVLDALDGRYEYFADSLAVISGVSGGSVGTLFFVAEQEARLCELEGSPRGSAFHASTASSLESIAFGATADDLYGTFIPLFRRVDRGQRLENSLVRRLPPHCRTGLWTMDDWGDLANQGRLPIVVFNATDARTGRRVLFDSVPTPFRESNIGLTSRPYNYRELLGGGNIQVDVSPATAARVSATFPYVSPFVRPDEPSPIGAATALGDGAYVDNEGIVTAVDWIEFILRNWWDKKNKNEVVPFDRILLLRICPSRSVDGPEPPKDGGLFASLRWLVGPLETIVNVRGASQVERGNMETDLAKLHLEDSSATGLAAVLTRTAQWGLQARPQPSRRPVWQVPEEAQSLQKKIIRSPKSAAAIRKFNAEEPSELDVQQRPPDSRPPGRRERITQPGVPRGVEKPENPVLEQDNPSERDKEIQLLADLPLLVLEVNFDNGSKEQEELVIPLNWKLSRAQHGIYSQAWARFEQDGKDTLELMDYLFVKRKPPLPAPQESP